MKIIILSPSKKNIGGVERFSFYLKDVLEKDFYEVEILGLEDLGFFVKKIIFILNKIGLGQILLGLFLGRKALNKGFDLCFTNGMLGWKLKNKKVINIQHGTFVLAAQRIDWGLNKIKFFIKRYVWAYFEGLAARNSLECVAVSFETKEAVVKYYNRKDVTVISNSVDSDFFKPKNKDDSRRKLGLALDKKILLFVGRFEYGKGGDILEEIKIESLTLNLIFITAENVSQKDLVDLYSAADIFVFPSKHEGCSYALLEAMSCGLIPVMSPVGLVPELKQNPLFTDCIVLEQTTKAYFSRINYLINLPESKKQDLSFGLREYILKNHSMDSFEKSYNSLVKKIIQQ